MIIIGYKGSPPYIQRMMDSILRPYKFFVRCYVDDIVIFSKIFKEYIEYLNTILGLFDRLNVTLKNIKTFLGYLSIILLKQRVDGFGILIFEKYIAVIRNLIFPQILKELEIYLGFTG